MVLGSVFTEDFSFIMRAAWGVGRSAVGEERKP